MSSGDLMGHMMMNTGVEKSSHQGGTVKGVEVDIGVSLIKV